ncbi:hypothetical protein ACA097_07020 [Pseudomonas sp. QL9]|uniref:Uncharacterized protein n=1 Tax=Pseudomonas knackmussii (strain DSM 6978 / CCUG 54928 / LMG 23759 / B13) TaxID=1301098 RepID=A0A024HBN6_PSEKB|nr:hypothetical protein [Pseudomonas knackmussii]CDF82470.1 hypothetical protein PKB_1105 [Pseudomonas knackmussii B13]
MDARTPPSAMPESEIALLANILALATRNMSAISTLLGQLSLELGRSTDPHLQQVGQRAVNDIGHLAADLDTQWQLIGSLARFCPLLKRTGVKPQPVLTEIHITELPSHD